MVISRRLYSLCILLAAILFAAGKVSAQVLHTLNSFRSRTFDGTVNVSWPVEFDGCTFVTDSVVLSRSYGAVFRNCRFESRSGRLYMADSGSGIILADCDITGSEGFSFSRNPMPADRNYITGVTVNGNEFDVQDEQESVIEIDGLELAGSVAGTSHGPLLMLMSTSANVLNAGETAMLRVRGLDDGMFIGWHVSDSTVSIKVGDDPCVCTVTAPSQVMEQGGFMVCAYTEYGLEAACRLCLVPQTVTVVPLERKVHKKRSIRDRKR